MTNDHEDEPLQKGLEAVPDSPKIIAAELRLMALGDDRYHRFTFIDPWIKNIWNAAADIIEDGIRLKMN